MQIIQLEKTTWRFDEARKLGADGGFGEVFVGEGEDGPVAVKRLKLSANEAAFRELKIGQALAARTLAHVVPVLDAGLDPDLERYFIVMPRCAGSLQDRLAGGALGEAETVAVALQIVLGLAEVGDLVHRDLKPANVLDHGGIWKIADFGIAKFVEDSTSLQTLRDCLTPPYGAPEQWRNERVTKATDVYALGCVIHALLTSKPPFVGAVEDIRQAHLHQAPGSLPDVSPRLAAIVAQMLRKSPEARPSLERCRTVLESIHANAPASGGRAALQAVSAEVAQAEATAEAERSATHSAALQRRVLTTEAVADLKRIFERLVNEIDQHTEGLNRQQGQLSLGSGLMHLGEINSVALPNGAQVSLPHSGWDVAAASSISVTGNHQYRGHSYTWSCSLLFSRPRGTNEYRWREVGFWSWNASGDAPHALRAHDRELDVALSTTMGMANFAVGPWPIDGEDEDAFIDRWIWIFARAAKGVLDRPGSLPVNDGFWRT